MPSCRVAMPRRAFLVRGSSVRPGGGAGEGAGAGAADGQTGMRTFCSRGRTAGCRQPVLRSGQTTTDGTRGQRRGVQWSRRCRPERHLRVPPRLRLLRLNRTPTALRRRQSSLFLRIKQIQCQRVQYSGALVKGYRPSAPAPAADAGDASPEGPRRQGLRLPSPATGRPWRVLGVPAGAWHRISGLRTRPDTAKPHLPVRRQGPARPGRCHDGHRRRRDVQQGAGWLGPGLSSLLCRAIASVMRDGRGHRMPRRAQRPRSPASSTPHSPLPREGG